MYIALSILIVLLVALFGIAATRPRTLRVERAVNIQAAPDKIYDFINDFRRWGAWSPYEKKDPAMKREFGSISRGKGATYAWDGNGQVGKGSMVIVDAVSSASVTIDLTFVKPMEGQNTVVFSLEPEGKDTRVVWSMVGPTTLMSRVMGIFLNMDKMIGSDFAVGLANLKAAAEKQ